MSRKIMGKTISKQEIEEQKERVKIWLEKSGYKVYTILRHVSASGMYRVISPVIFADGRVLHISYATAIITGYKYSEKYHHAAIGISGCGMDMGFDLVYNLSSALYGHEERGAYKINQEWI